MLLKIIFTFTFFCVTIFGDQVKIFAASNTKLAIQEIVELFKKNHSQSDIVLMFGGSGKAYAQFSNGLDYDIFISADSKYPNNIKNDGNAISSPKVYAYGRVALYSKNKELIKLGYEALKSDKVKHISIANPRLAPYGVAAMDIIRNYGLEDSVKDKLVLGDNIAQGVLFVDSGAAEIGLVAYSLIKTTKDQSEYFLIDQSKHFAMEQSFVVTKYAKNKSLAHEFATFLTAKESQKVFEKYGYNIH